MLLHQSFSIDTCGVKIGEYKMGGLRRKVNAFEEKLEAYFRNHLISFALFVFLGMPLLILLGVTLFTTIFALLFYGIAFLV